MSISTNKYYLYPPTKYLYILYDSLKSTMYSKTSVDLKTIQEYIKNFLIIDNEKNYEIMTESINYWITSTTIPQTAVGIICNETPAVKQIQGLRVIVIMSDGTVAYDSNSTNNYYENFGKPRPDFLTSGKYLINENHGTRSYFQNANNSGTFYMKKYSKSANDDLLYLCFRQGTTISNPLGVVVININYSLESQLINSDNVGSQKQS